ncbi:YjeF domain protein, partial [Ostertagia ostertagi]
MKILSAEDIRLWDQFTMQHEPITSIDLMERAALRCVDWLHENMPGKDQFAIFCGKGNNGGDGLAIARMLALQQFQVTVYILEFGHIGTPDFQANLARLHQTESVEIIFIQPGQAFHEIKDEIVIDALFGSGLNRQLEGMTAALVDHINNSHSTVISIDIPSGMFVDRSSKTNTVIRATHTLSFQCLKPAFLVAENEECIGALHILDIDLHDGFYPTVAGLYEWVDTAVIQTIHRPRKRFAHKGNFGHALLVAGSYGKMGAAVLSASACLRSGAGLLTCHIPSCGYLILQTSLPEAMVITDKNEEKITNVSADLSIYEAIGIGPGIGTASETKMALREILDNYRLPLVIDADALNILATQKDLLQLVPAGSILTPHPKEFERLFGPTSDDFDRISRALQKAKEHNIIIILKGHHTLIATPDGKGFFNSTGNAGMATGGSGDVLTGILTGLLAQRYSGIEAAILGVYLHGLAGDVAAKQLSMEAMLA